jgi:CP family cyanate transporter-like MFS transporter
MSAAMFTISYPCAVVLPILGGYAWDATGIPALAFAPVGLGALIAASGIGIVVGGGPAIVFWAAVLGFANDVALVLMLALPALLGAPGDVQRLSAAMFTISYPCAVVLPILGGYAWDLTGSPVLAFAPVGLGALAILALSPGLKLARAH